MTKFLRQIAPKIEYVFEKVQSETHNMTIPTILPYIEFLYETKKPKSIRTPYQTLIYKVSKEFGLGPTTRPLMRVPTNNLHSYKSGHAPDRGVWKPGYQRVWDAIDAEYEARKKKPEAVAVKPAPAAVQYQEKSGGTNIIDEPTPKNWREHRLGTDTIYSDLYEPRHKKDQMYFYVYERTNYPDRCKPGEHLVPALAYPVDHILKYFYGPSGTGKFKGDMVPNERRDGTRIEPTLILRAVRNVTKLARDVLKKRYPNNPEKWWDLAGVHIDNWIMKRVRGAVRKKGDEFYISPGDLIKKVDTLLNKYNSPLPVAALSPWQGQEAENLISDINNGKRTILESLCPRFGKTLWAASVARELGFDRAPLTVIGSYIPSSLSSFEDQVAGITEQGAYEQFKDFAVINTHDPDYKEKVEKALSQRKQVIALLSLCAGPKRAERMRTLFKGLTDNRLIFIDEADYGAWQPNQFKAIQRNRRKDKRGKYIDPLILMSGTNPTRAQSEHELDSQHYVTYIDLLRQKSTQYMKEKFKSINKFEIDAPRFNEGIVPMVAVKLGLQNIVDFAKENDKEAYQYLNAGDMLPSWAKFAQNPIKSLGFWNRMLEAMLEDKNNLPGKPNGIFLDGIKEEMNKDAKYKMQNPDASRIMIFIPQMTRVRDINKLVAKTRQKYPGWKVIKVTGKGSDEEGKPLTDKQAMTNATAEQEVRNEIDATPSNQPVLVISAGMGSRSFSVPQIDTVVLASDGGSVGTTVQKACRVFTPEDRGGYPQKVGMIVGLSFNPNADDKIAALHHEATVAIKDREGIPYAKAAKEVNDTVDLFARDKDGKLAKFNYNKDMKDMMATTKGPQIMARQVDMDKLTAVQKRWLAKSPIKSPKLPKQEVAEHGKTFKPIALGDVPRISLKLKSSEEKKIIEVMAGLYHGMSKVRPWVQKKTGKNIKTLDTALHTIKSNPTWNKQWTNHFGIPFRHIVDIYTGGATNQDLAAQAYDDNE